MRNTTAASQTQDEPDRLALLGTMPDAELARRLGVSRERVRQLRVRHGLPRYVPPAQEWHALLGSVRDRDIASMYGLHENHVAIVRQKAKIPALPKAAAMRARILAVQERLGNESDASLARELGTATTSVKRVRRELGIPSINAERT